MLRRTNRSPNLGSSPPHSSLDVDFSPSPNVLGLFVASSGGGRPRLHFSSVPRARLPSLIGRLPANRVLHALLREARLGGTSKLLIRGLGIAGGLGIGLALFHEAGLGRACQLLLSSLGRTGALGRQGRAAHQKCSHHHPSTHHRSPPR